jgi:conjugal transfer pilus assembly protein TrbC
MKFSMFQALLVSGLLFCVPAVMASPPQGMSVQDKDWLKKQQQALAEFKETLAGQVPGLPPEQQQRVDTLQQSIRTSQGGQENNEKRTFEAIYFVSLGIPREGLLPMLQDANRYGIPATLRGLLDNNFRKTAEVMFDLTKEDNKAGVQIDPTLFSDYHISAVPALVVNCPGHSDVIRGSLPLKEALEKVAEKGDCAPTARRLLEAAR